MKKILLTFLTIFIIAGLIPAVVAEAKSAEAPMVAVSANDRGAISLQNTAAAEAETVSEDGGVTTGGGYLSAGYNPDDYSYPTRDLYYTSPVQTGNDVRWVQSVLLNLGYSITVDGSYGPSTRDVVKQFQKAYGLTVDGKAGPATRTKLRERWAAMKAGAMNSLTVSKSALSLGIYSSTSTTFTVTCNGPWASISWSTSSCYSVQCTNQNGGVLTFKVTANSVGSDTITFYLHNEADITVATKSVSVTVAGASLSTSHSSVSVDMSSQSGVNVTLTAGGNLPSSYYVQYGTSSSRLNLSLGSWSGKSISLTIKGRSPGTDMIEVYLKNSANDTTIATVRISVTVTIQYSTITGNAVCSTSVSYGGEVRYYAYTPSVSGTYVIYSTGSEDTRVYLYNASFSELASDDDGGEGTNFRLAYSLTAGTRYYFGVKYYNSSRTGTIHFVFGQVFTITYNANGGSGAPSSQSKDYNAALTLSSSTPTRSGYDFLGWSTSSTATTAMYQPGASFTTNANTTLYAVWEPITYTLTYSANGGSGAPASQSGAKSYTVSSTIPTRFGYTFLGWSTSSTATTESTTPGYTVTLTADTTLYAVWEPALAIETGYEYPTSVSFANKEVYYTFTPSASAEYTFKSTGSLDSRVYLYNASGTLLGSDDDSGDEGNNFKLQLPLTSGTTYYVKVRAYGTHTGTTLLRIVRASYTVSYDANGGSGAPDSQTLIPGQQLILSTTEPQNPGYCFIGWGTSSTATIPSYLPGSSYTQYADITLYAIWGEHRYSNVCDRYCDYCGTLRDDVPHAYANACDSTCDGCGATRTPAAHVYTATVTQPSTCTIAGVKTYTCTECGYRYTESLALANHVSTSSVVAYPTCTTNGMRLYSCSVCSRTLSTETIPLLGHSWCSATCTAPRTCSTCGATSGQALGHNYKLIGEQSASCTTAGSKLYECARCDDLYTETIFALGHAWVEATCTAPKTCSTCGVISGEALGHNYTDEVTVQPTCTATGVRTYTCSACEHSYTESIAKVAHIWYGATCTRPMCCSMCGAVYAPAVGHNYVLVTETSATCTTDGLKIYDCTRCNDTYTETEDALGHTWVDATCTAPKTCSTCGATSGEALGHTYTFVITKQPTCTVGGTKVYTCSTCKHSYTESIPALGHAWVDATCTTPKTCAVCGVTSGSGLPHAYTDEVTVQPTCTATGVRTYTCPACEHSYTESIPALGHAWVDATCTTPETCSTCGATVGQALSHSYIDVVTKRPTCTAAGVRTYTCSACNHTYTESIPALDHTWANPTCTTPRTCSGCGRTMGQALGHSYMDSVTKQPTCTADGVRTYRCRSCSHRYTESIPALGHTWVDATCTVPQTCSVCSTTSGEALGHTYTAAITQQPTCTVGGTKVYTCSVCEHSYTESVAALGHAWVDATCTTPKTCSACGETSGKALGHSYTDKVTKQPTCTATGVRTYTCSTCRHTYTESIPASGHTWVDATCTAPKTCATCGTTSGAPLVHTYTDKVTKQPTCTTAGERTYTCSTCRHTYTESIPALDHTWVDATCTSPKTCSVCGATSGSMLPHTYTSAITKQPTCAVGGVRTYTCSVCTYSYIESVAALGHTWREATCTTPKTCTVCGETSGNALGHTYRDQITVEPTCTEDGVRTYTCTACGWWYTEVVPDLDHAFDEGVVTQKATCKKTGIKTYTCQRCGGTRSEVIDKIANHEYVDATCIKPQTCIYCNDTLGSALGHSYTATVTKQPTCTTGGMKTYRCSACPHSYAESIPALGHTWTEATCSQPERCTACGITEGAALGHSYTATVTKQPTCTTDGVKTYTCATCANTYTESLAQYGHQYEMGDVVAPDCLTAGYTAHICARCGDNYTTDETPALGHRYDNACDTACNTCGAIRKVSDHVWSKGACSTCGTASPSKVAITTAPKTTYGKEGATVKLTVKATGEGLKYAWYVKNATASKYGKSSVTSTTYSVTVNDASHGRSVYCVVTDKYGNEVKTTTVLIRRQATITKEPATTAYAKKGAKVSLKITAKGDGLKYAWYVKNDGASKYSKVSVTSATYTATMGSTVKGRRVYCIVTDKYGKTVQSKTFLLRESVSITTQPKTVTVKKNATAKVTIKASGDGLKYTWYVKKPGASKYTKVSGSKTSYSLKMTSKVKNTQVYCVVTDKYGNTIKSTVVKLKMK